MPITVFGVRGCANATLNCRPHLRSSTHCPTHRDRHALVDLDELADDRDRLALVGREPRDGVVLRRLGT